MKLIKELLTIFNRGIVMERMTSKHVLSRDDITVIMNAIKTEFGIPKQTNNNLGLCMLSQVIFSIAAVADIPEDEIGKYVHEISYRTSGETFNNLGKLIHWFNKTPIKIGDKYFQFKLNAHAINDAEGMMKELKSGQPIICAVPSGGTVDDMIGTFGDYHKNKDVPEWARDKFNKDEKYDYEYDHGEPIESVVKDLSNGFISKELWDAKMKDENDNEDAYAYHSSLCIGYESGDDAFLFREPRHSYARAGYYKIAKSLMTPENIGLNKPLIHGMFYVEVMDMKEVPAPKNDKDDSEDQEEDW